MSDINVTVQDEIVNIDVIDTPVLVEVSNAPGPAGAGVAVGGTTGQVLAKASDANYDTVWINPSTGGVPYSGATGNVNLGEYELKAGQVTLDTSPTGTAAVGTIRWNDSTGTSETTLKGGNVIIKNGVDLVARVVNKVSPNTTLTKAAYQAVRVSGAQGQRLAIELAQANNDAGSADTIGLVTETIAPNQEGFIMTVGQLEGINTTGSLQGETWVDGDVLYLSPTTAGAITNVKPTGATGHLVIIGYVEYAHANNGKLYIKVANGFEIDELHNVSIVTPTNNQGLFYNSSNSLWENKTISTALGYTPVPTTRNITINGVTYDLSADRTWTIPTGISGSGAAGQVTYWTGASAVSGSNLLFWNTTNTNLGIGLQPQHTGTTAEIYGQVGRVSALFIKGAVSGVSYPLAIASDSAGRGFVIGQSTLTPTNFATGGFQLNASSTGGSINAYTNISTGVEGTLFLQSGAGKTVLGSTSDNGQRLQVYGDTLLRGSGNTSATTALTVQNSSSTNLFTVRNDGNVGIGTNIPTEELTVVGTIRSNAKSGADNVFLEGYNSAGTFIAQLKEASSGGFGGLQFNGQRNDATGGAGIFFNSFVGTTASGNNAAVQFNANGGIITSPADLPTGIPIAIFSKRSGGVIVNQMALFQSGNLLLQNGGTFTDGGQRLQVIGDTLLRGSGATSATTALTVQNSSSTNLFTVRNDGNTIVGTGTPTSFYLRGMAVSGTTGDIGLGVFNSSTTGTAGFTLGQSNSAFASFFKWGSAYVGNFAGSSIPFANASQFQSGTNNDLTLIFQGTPIVFNCGLTSTNIAARISTGSYRITTLSNAHTDGTALLDLDVSTTARASLRIRSGTAPTSPNDGDIWFDGTDIKMRIGGVTKTFTLV